MSDDLVFSTKGGKTKKQKKTDPNSNFQGSSGPAKMRLESKGRGGKTVTVIFELPFDGKEAKKHMKNMQALFGCGATLKSGTIELRGDVCDKVSDYFKKNDMKVVRAGG
jgi:translation initiation factor 1